MIKQAWNLAQKQFPWLREMYDWVRTDIFEEEGIPWEAPIAAIREDGGLTVKFKDSTWHFRLSVERPEMSNRVKRA